MNLYEQYLEAKAKLDAAKKEFEQMQSTLYTRYIDELNRTEFGKTFSTEADGFKINIIKKETVSVDQELASVVEVGFSKKYSLNKSAYKKLSDEDKRRVDECLTSKPAKPSFKVERL